MYLCFDGKKPILGGFSNLDMAKNVDTPRSISGYLLTFEGVSHGNLTFKYVLLSYYGSIIYSHLRAMKKDIADEYIISEAWNKTKEVYGV